jgi:hypothetical protein
MDVPRDSCVDGEDDGHARRLAHGERWLNIAQGLIALHIVNDASFGPCRARQRAITSSVVWCRSP